ncbi:hypothetical protein RB195_012802 [Necator americanus]|uniref:Uncharacterized protein n=1 Tax=Necator americanus TaxID=51031 RepID=A0ABR1DSM6_NECAM
MKPTTPPATNHVAREDIPVLMQRKNFLSHLRSQIPGVIFNNKKHTSLRGAVDGFPWTTFPLKLCGAKIKSCSATLNTVDDVDVGEAALPIWGGVLQHRVQQVYCMEKHQWFDSTSIPTKPFICSKPVNWYQSSPRG